jgi:hypothetical protein
MVVKREHLRKRKIRRQKMTLVDVNDPVSLAAEPKELVNQWAIVPLAFFCFYALGL